MLVEELDNAQDDKQDLIRDDLFNKDLLDEDVLLPHPTATIKIEPNIDIVPENEPPFIDPTVTVTNENADDKLIYVIPPKTLHTNLKRKALENKDRTKLTRYSNLSRIYRRNEANKIFKLV